MQASTTAIIDLNTLASQLTKFEGRICAIEEEVAWRVNDEGLLPMVHGTNRNVDVVDTNVGVMQSAKEASTVSMGNVDGVKACRVEHMEKMPSDMWNVLEAGLSNIESQFKLQNVVLEEIKKMICRLTTVIDNKSIKTNLPMSDHENDHQEKEHAPNVKVSQIKSSLEEIRRGLVNSPKTGSSGDEVAMISMGIDEESQVDFAKMFTAAAAGTEKGLQTNFATVPTTAASGMEKASQTDFESKAIALKGQDSFGSTLSSTHASVEFPPSLNTCFSLLNSQKTSLVSPSRMASPPPSPQVSQHGRLIRSKSQPLNSLKVANQNSNCSGLASPFLSTRSVYIPADLNLCATNDRRSLPPPVVRSCVHPSSPHHGTAQAPQMCWNSVRLAAGNGTSAGACTGLPPGMDVVFF